MKTIKLSAPEIQKFWEIPVVWEDQHLLALEKPAGLLTAPDAFSTDAMTLLGLLHAGVLTGRPWARERELQYVMNVNHLDQEVGGIVLCARSKELFSTLQNALGAEKHVREYSVLVNSEPDEESFSMEARLAPDQRRPGYMRIDPNGKRCRTECKVIERFQGFTLLTCKVFSERRHQVRLHLRYKSFPVVSDPSYGGRPLLLSRLKDEYRLKGNAKERPLLTSPAVHASRWTLPHPVSGETISLEAPLPREMNVSLKYLRRYAAR